MKVVRQLQQENENTAVALGCFDGLHKGHKAVISGAISQREHGLTPCVFTFTSSPQRELTGTGAPRLMLPEEKETMLEAMGVEVLYLLPFASVMDMEPETFVQDILVNLLHAKKVYCGFNYHFGKGGRADSDDLQRICRQYGVEAFTVQPVMDTEAPVSSTRIRNMVETGDMESANRMLGRPFSYRLQVVHGRKLGSVMGTPTLNQYLPEGFILPKFGVYASVVSFDDVQTYGVTNIGVKPTVGSDAPLSETWMPEYQGGELYGKMVTVQLLHFLRPEKKFDSIDQLREAILKNGEQAKARFSMGLPFDIE